MCWTGNSAGSHRHFRRMLEEAGVGHVVGLPGSQQVASLTGAWRLAQPAGDAPEDEVRAANPVVAKDALSRDVVPSVIHQCVGTSP